MDPWRSKDLRKLNLEFGRRNIFMVFHGRSGAITDAYSNVTARAEIIQSFVDQATGLVKEEFPDISVGGFVPDYHSLLGQSIFCLAPRGITPWTIHLYVSILVGCIPIIISDHFILPYANLLDYNKFSIRWPEKNFDAKELYYYLKNLVNNKGA